MAKYRKNKQPPIFMNSFVIPEKLKPIVKAFFAESSKVAKELIVQALNAIYGSDEDEIFDCYDRKKHNITPEEIEGVCSLMQGLKPQDMLEALFASQIVVSHMLGLRKLAKGSASDQKLGLKLLRFSSEAISQLQKKRTGGIQNITVNYNHCESRTASAQTLLTGNEYASEGSETLRS